MHSKKTDNIKEKSLMTKKCVKVSICILLALVLAGGPIFQMEAMAADQKRPEKVSATSNSETNDVVLTWNKVKGAEFYSVYRSTKKKIPSKAYAIVETNKFKDRNLEGGKYYYWVKAEDEEGIETPASTRAGIIVKDYLTLSEIRTVTWSATLRKTITLDGMKLKKGTTVKPTKHSKYIPFRGPKRVYITYKNEEGKKVASGWVKWSTVKSIKGHVSYDKKKKKLLDWTEKKKESYVKRYSSKTKYLVWTNFYTQRVNIFRGKKGNWNLIKTFRCTSGKYGKQTPKGVMVLKKHKPRRTRYNGVLSLRYYYKYLSFFNGYDAFHSVAWRLPDNKLIKKIMKDGTPNTTGCVRLSVENAKYMYKRIPLGTKVVMY